MTFILKFKHLKYKLTLNLFFLFSLTHVVYIEYSHQVKNNFWPKFHIEYSVPKLTLKLFFSLLSMTCCCISSLPHNFWSIFSQFLFNFCIARCLALDGSWIRYAFMYVWWYGFHVEDGRQWSSEYDCIEFRKYVQQRNLYRWTYTW